MGVGLIPFDWFWLGHYCGQRKGSGHGTLTIDSLFGLLDQSVSEDFPGQVLGDSIDLLECLW